MRNILLLIFLLFLSPFLLHSQSSGTGFALNNGYIVTNYHVIEDAKTIFILGIRGDINKKYIADVVAVDKNNDLAILRISGNGFQGFGSVPYKIRPSGTVRV